eukprot:symbB.v1.2.027070.t1/scaffold2752.1/size71575/3
MQTGNDIFKPSWDGRHRPRNKAQENSKRCQHQAEEERRPPEAPDATAVFPWLPVLFLFAVGLWGSLENVYFYTARTVTTESDSTGETSFKQSKDILTNIPGRFLGDEGLSPPETAKPFFEASIDFDVSKVVDPILASSWFDWILDTGLLDFLSKG